MARRASRSIQSAAAAATAASSAPAALTPAVATSVSSSAPSGLASATMQPSTVVSVVVKAEVEAVAPGDASKAAAFDAVLQRARRRTSGSAAGAASAAADGSATVKIEYEQSVAISSDSSGKSLKRSRDARPVKAPEHWELVYENIRQMRSKRDAPVDTMGAEVLPETNVAPAVFRYQTLISLMLSSQTKDQITAAATKKLQQYGLTPENIATASEEKIGELIYPVGFWRRKAEYIKHTTAVLLEKYGGDIPDSVEGLIALKGVGPKMAHLVMTIAWQRTMGIGVDVHVHRICNRLGWVKTADKTPEHTRLALEEWLPTSHWAEINLLFVGFGQQICTPVNPNCDTCLNKALCPVGRRATGARKPVASSSESN